MGYLLGHADRGGDNRHCQGLAWGAFDLVPEHGREAQRGGPIPQCAVATSFREGFADEGKEVSCLVCFRCSMSSRVHRFIDVSSIASQVPSGFFAADCFLYLDALLHKKLFRPKIDRGESRLQLAASEGVRCKRAIGALRYLWRNSAGSYNQNVHELKSHLQSSPLQGRSLRPALAEAAGDEDGDDPMSGPEIEEPAGEDDQCVEASGDDQEDEESADADREEEVDEAAMQALPDLDADEDDESNESDSEETEDSLNAPTEVMGEPPKGKPSKRLAVHPELEEPQDSQVKTGCGWLGKAYQAESLAKEAKRSSKDKAQSRALMIRDIREYMSVDCGLSGQPDSNTCWGRAVRIFEGS